MATKNETHLYDPGGIQATLVNVPVHRCATCGDFEVEIPLVLQLNRALADALIRKPTRLTATEIRFLRKALGWSGVDFARHMGVDAATVSRWEAGQKMGASAERLLRLAVSVGRQRNLPKAAKPSQGRLQDQTWEESPQEQQATPPHQF